MRFASTRRSARRAGTTTDGGRSIDPLIQPASYGEAQAGIKADEGGPLKSRWRGLRGANHQHLARMSPGSSRRACDPDHAVAPGAIELAVAPVPHTRGTPKARAARGCGALGKIAHERPEPRAAYARHSASSRAAPPVPERRATNECSAAGIGGRLGRAREARPRCPQPSATTVGKRRPGPSCAWSCASVHEDVSKVATESHAIVVVAAIAGESAGVASRVSVGPRHR